MGKSRVVWILVPVLLAVAAVIVWSCLHVRQVKQEIPRIQLENERNKLELLTYIGEHDGEALDYDAVCLRLGCSRRQVYRYLLELEQEDEIVAVQRNLRKPILLSDDDYTNYYWRVYIKSEEHPHSELGQ